MKNMKVMQSKIFYFFMSFMTFMVKINYFKNFQKLTGWLMAVLDQPLMKTELKIILK
jgi:hypothetical protein